jgi:hypothetical protein
MIYVIPALLGLLLLFLIIEFVLNVLGVYRCPTCGEWVRLGVNATNCEQTGGYWILCHGEHSHKHTTGWHGIGGKPLE